MKRAHAGKMTRGLMIRTLTVGLVVATAAWGCGDGGSGGTGSARAVTGSPAAATAAATAAPGAVAGSGSAAPASPGGVEISWYGQSAFTVHSPGDIRVLMDPIPGSMGYTLPESIECDVVTITHEHPDHINVDLAAGDPKILRGLTEDKSDWSKIDETFGDVHIFTVPTYHDAVEGKERGLNAVFVLEIGDLRLVHLGDLGHELTAEQLTAIGRVDVLLVPVGGKYTIDAAGATKVVEQLQPKQIIVPMHYKTAALGPDSPLASVDAFLDGKANVRRIDGRSVTVSPGDLTEAPELLVLGYE